MAKILRLLKLRAQIGAIIMHKYAANDTFSVEYWMGHQIRLAKILRSM